jgi:uncharacterized membrane protein YkvA (DUF1232 family)
LLEQLKQAACRLESETFALYLAARDPRTPWYAKLLVAGFVAYAFSPIDLIPDFIPILGYLDDLIFAPLGTALAIRLIPRPILAECRVPSAECRLQAQETIQHEARVSRLAGATVIAIWILLAVLLTLWADQAFVGQSGT